MTEYTHHITETNSVDIDTAIWKLTRHQGNYICENFHVNDYHGVFADLCEKLHLTYELDEASGVARNDQIFLTFSWSSFIIRYNVNIANKIRSAIDEIPKFESSLTAKWWFMENNNPNYHELQLTGADPRDEFYPWMRQSIASFARDFAASSSNVLLLLGPPGTGKTTFIRGLCRLMKIETWVTYDRQVQETESFYVSFARINDDDDCGRCLVVEDSDELLSKREEGNKIMNRLLNISDGLITLPSRKIIFSTNLPGLKSIDEALLRPGRCFGAINFRELSRQEAAAACAAAGMELDTHKTKLTLSEALNGQKNQNNVIQVIGFS